MDECTPPPRTMPCTAASHCHAPHSSFTSRSFSVFELCDELEQVVCCSVRGCFEDKLTTPHGLICEGVNGQVCGTERGVRVTLYERDAAFAARKQAGASTRPLFSST